MLVPPGDEDEIGVSVEGGSAAAQLLQLGAEGPGNDPIRGGKAIGMCVLGPVVQHGHVKVVDLGDLSQRHGNMACAGNDEVGGLRQHFHKEPERCFARATLGQPYSVADRDGPAPHNLGASSLHPARQMTDRPASRGRRPRRAHRAQSTHSRPVPDRRPSPSPPQMSDAPQSRQGRHRAAPASGPSSACQRSIKTVITPPQTPRLSMLMASVRST